jgi:hypothetical protein
MDVIARDFSLAIDKIKHCCYLAKASDDLYQEKKLLLL